LEEYRRLDSQRADAWRRQDSGVVVMPVTIYKVGGSLLTWPDLPARLMQLIAARRTDPLFVVGGGEAADLVREWSNRFSLTDEAAHWLAIQAMGLNERLLAAVLPEAPIVATREEAGIVWRSRRAAILNAEAFLRAEEMEVALRQSADGAGDLLLLHSWEATSDSIAAWIAARWPADELCLLKSADPGCNPSNVEGLVDRQFPRWAARIDKVVVMNLRAENPQPVPW